MTKITDVGKVLIGAVIGVLLTVFIVAFQNKPSGDSAPNNGTGANTAPSTQTSGQVSGQTSGQTQPKAQSPASAARVAPRPPARPTMTFVTPAPSDSWKMETQNVIAWSREGGISGDIYLIDAKTQRFVGVILPQVGPHQTSYTWNTRDVLLDRVSPLKKSILPGTYILKIAFDGNNLPVIASPVVTITN